MTDIRSATAPAPLSRFADEIAGMAERLCGTRFQGSERYVMDTDALGRDLIDLAARMRRAASEKPAEPPTLLESVFGPNHMDAAPMRRPVYTTVPDQHGRPVRVERRRRG